MQSKDVHPIKKYYFDSHFLEITFEFWFWNLDVPDVKHLIVQS